MPLAEHFTALRAYCTRYLPVGENPTLSVSHCRDARVYGHWATAMHEMSTLPVALPPLSSDFSCVSNLRSLPPPVLTFSTPSKSPLCRPLLLQTTMPPILPPTPPHGCFSFSRNVYVFPCSDSPLKQLKAFPQELVLMGRATVMIKGIAAALGLKWNLAARVSCKAVPCLDSTASYMLLGWCI